MTLAAAILAPLGVASRAEASELDRCIEAAEASQQLSAAGKLVQARQRLLECRAASCPTLVRNDCEAWAARVESGIPTVVFAAVDETGADVTASTSIALDGTLVEKAGRAVPLDPGEHRVRVRGDGIVTAETTFTAREGEKQRIVTLTVHRIASPQPPPTASERHVPVSSWVLFGGSGVAFLTAGIFTALTVSKRSALADDCATPQPRCTSDDVAPGRAYATVADVAFGVGLFAAAVGTVLWLTSSPSPASAQAAQR